jgi:choline-sulfatase
LHERGFTEVVETGDKFTAQVMTPYTEHLQQRGLLDRYRQHIADRSYHGENERGGGATKRVPMWDATPSPVPLPDYIDTWHGDLAVRWIEERTAANPFFLFVGFPGPHDPWDAPRDAVEKFGPSAPTMPSSTKRPDLDGLGDYGKLMRGMLQLSDTDTMTDEAIAGMRRAYCANVSVIDDAVGRIVDALDRRGLLDDTWVVYTSDHGEMGGNHGMMSKCVLYEQTVRVPLIVRPPGGATGRVVDDLVEHVDVPATVREIAGAPAVVESEARSLLGYIDGNVPEARAVSISENWGFASFETEQYRLIVDEDRMQPCQMFDLERDPAEDTNLVADPDAAGALEELMGTVVAPFLATAAYRPHPSPFA